MPYAESREAFDLFLPVHFERRSATLTEAARSILERTYTLLRKDPTLRLCVVGHCDMYGSTEYNEELGMARAEAVRDYLVELGCEPERLTLRSDGKSRQLDPRGTQEAGERNRRVEFERIEE